jgi:cell shape-determining protein MreC
MKTGNPRPIVTRLSLLVTFLAALVAGGLNLTRLKQKITLLQSNLTAQTAARQKAETDLTEAETKLAATTAALKETRTALEASTAEKQQALANVATQTSRAEKLSSELTKTRTERDDAQTTLARFRGAGLEPEQIIVAARQLKSLQADLAAAQATNKLLVAEIIRLRPDLPGPVLLPASLKAKVAAADPKWRFLVLDAGRNQGVLRNGELLVSRQGKLVARAKVRRVQEDCCVADLLPGWDLADVVEGDIAIPAFPHS